MPESPNRMVWLDGPGNFKLTDYEPDWFVVEQGEHGLAIRRRRRTAIPAIPKAKGILFDGSGVATGTFCTPGLKIKEYPGLLLLNEGSI
jgi:hypothetical protein